MKNVSNLPSKQKISFFLQQNKVVSMTIPVVVTVVLEEFPCSTEITGRLPFNLARPAGFGHIVCLLHVSSQVVP